MKKSLASVFVFAILLGLGFSVLFPYCASACSCAEQSPEGAFAGSEAVFAGEVIETGGRSLRSIVSGKSSVTFRVSEVWKGPEGETLEVFSELPSGAGCGYSFEEGQEYLVYAFEGLEVPPCGNGTKLLSEAGAEMEALGDGETPEGGSVAPDAPGGGLGSILTPAGWWAAVAGLVAVAAAAAFWLFRRRLRGGTRGPFS